MFKYFLFFFCWYLVLYKNDFMIYFYVIKYEVFLFCDKINFCILYINSMKDSMFSWYFLNIEVLMICIIEDIKYKDFYCIYR